MKLFDLVTEAELGRLQELAPPVPPPTGSPAPNTPPAGQQPPDPQMQAKMMAQQALDRMNQKKAVQDQIKQKQEELAALQKQLAAIK